MRCSTCGKEIDGEVRYCSMCKSPLCLECVRYMVVKRKLVYREYYESVPVCKDCMPEARLRKKLARIVDEVFE